MSDHRASVGFLSVPGVDAVTRTIVLLSVMLTLGSIITSVFLLWRHQGGGRRLEYSVSPLLFEIISFCPFTFLMITVFTGTFGIQHGPVGNHSQYPVYLPSLGRADISSGHRTVFLLRISIHNARD